MIPVLCLLLLYWPSVLSSQAQSLFRVPNWANAEPNSLETGEGYTRTVRSSANYKVVHNAWWQAHRFYAMLKPEDMGHQDVLEDGLSTNQAIIGMPVANMTSFRDNLRVAFVPGNTLLVDFPFQVFSDHLGHWAEIMVPTYSVFRDGQWQKDLQTVGTGYIDRVVTPNMNRQHGPWFAAVFQAALQPGTQPGKSLPYIVDYADLASFDQLGWVVFENLLVVQDRWGRHANSRSGSSTSTLHFAAACFTSKPCVLHRCPTHPQMLPA